MTRGVPSSHEPHQASPNAVRRFLHRGSFGAASVQTFGRAAALIVQVLLARSLGVDEFGVYVVVIAWITVLGVLAKMGLDTTVLRFVAAYAHAGNWTALRGLLLTADRWAALASGLVVLSLFVFLLIVRGHLTPTTSRAFMAAGALLPVLVFIALRGAALRALRRIIRGLLPDLLLRHVLFAVLLGVAVALNGRVTLAYQAILLQTVACAAALAIAASWLRKAVPAPVHAAQPTYDARQWFHVALSLLLVTGMNLVIGQTSIILVGALDSARAAGVYAVAHRIGVLTTFALLATNTTLAPVISELYSAGKSEELQSAVRHAARITFALTVPIALGLLVAGPWLLRLFGTDFAVGYPALVALIAGQVMNAFVGPAGFLLVMTRHHRAAARILVFSALFNIAANAVLIPRFSIVGAATATATTLVIWNGLMFWFTWHLLGVNSSFAGGSPLVRGAPNHERDGGPFRHST